MIRRALIALSLVLSACTRPEVTRYDPATYTDGFVYPRPLPFLQVKADGTSQIVYLPDPDPRHRSVLRIRGVIGDATLSPVFQDGWNLTSAQVSNEGASSALQSIVSAIGAVKSGFAVGALYGREDAAATPAPGLYRIDVGNMKLIGPMVLEAK